MKIEPDDRSSREINLLERFFKANLYFRKLSDLYEEKTIQYLFKKMRFIEFEAGDTVFEYGDVGEHFYVIIEGIVAIKVPS